jgi:hypothetical protein
MHRTYHLQLLFQVAWRDAAVYRRPGSRIFGLNLKCHGAMPGANNAWHAPLHKLRHKRGSSIHHTRAPGTMPTHLVLNRRSSRRTGAAPRPRARPSPRTCPRTTAAARRRSWWPAGSSAPGPLPAATAVGGRSVARSEGSVRASWLHERGQGAPRDGATAFHTHSPPQAPACTHLVVQRRRELQELVGAVLAGAPAQHASAHGKRGGQRMRR